MQSARKLPPPEPRLKKKILIVDDGEMAHVLLSKLFKPDIYEVYKTYSGEQALALIRQLPPGCFDAILTDFHMPPGMNGGTFIQQCRSLPGYHDKPIVLISGEPAQKLEKVMNEVGANAYFTKPVSSKDLLGYLEPIFHKQDEELDLIGDIRG